MVQRTYPTYFAVTEPAMDVRASRVRFECIEQDAAQLYATQVYRDEKVVCEIHEHTRQH